MIANTATASWPLTSSSTILKKITTQPKLNSRMNVPTPFLKIRCSNEKSQKCFVNLNVFFFNR